MSIAIINHPFSWELYIYQFIPTIVTAGWFMMVIPTFLRQGSVCQCSLQAVYLRQQKRPPQLVAQTLSSEARNAAGISMGRFTRSACGIFKELSWIYYGSVMAIFMFLFVDGIVDGFLERNFI